VANGSSRKSLSSSAIALDALHLEKGFELPAPRRIVESPVEIASRWREDAECSNEEAAERERGRWRRYGRGPLFPHEDVPRARTKGEKRMLIYRDAMMPRVQKDISLGKPVIVTSIAGYSGFFIMLVN